MLQAKKRKDENVFNILYYGRGDGFSGWRKVASENGAQKRADVAGEGGKRRAGWPGAAW